MLKQLRNFIPDHDQQALYKLYNAYLRSVLKTVFKNGVFPVFYAFNAK